MNAQKNRLCIAAVALGAALLAPIGLSAVAQASPTVPVAERAANTAAALTVDPIVYTKGERLFVSGTAAPFAEIAIEGVPADMSQGFPMSLKGARANADGVFHAGGIRMTSGLDRFDATFSHGDESVTVTAVATDDAADVLVVTSPEMGAVTTNSVNQVTFAGRSSLGGTVRVETTGGRVLARAQVNPSTGTWALRGEIAYDLMYTVNVVAEGAGGETETVQHQVKVVKPSA